MEDSDACILSEFCGAGRALEVTWLEPLPASSPKYLRYKLPNGFGFPRDDVLNHELGEEGKTLRRGDHIEGFALGYTTISIPEIYRHGTLVAANFFVADALGREHCGGVQFIVDCL